jgi:hypothetical protein
MSKVGVSDAIELETPDGIDTNVQCTDMYKVSYTNTDMRYDDFFRQFLYRNRPCVVRGHVTESWKSANEWISNNRPNFSYISQKYGMYYEYRVTEMLHVVCFFQVNTDCLKHGF